MSYVHSSTAEAMAAVRKALRAAVELTEKAEKAKKRYSDQIYTAMEKELNEQYSNLCADARHALEKARQASLARVDQAVANALSIGDAEEDFKLLSLPVTLSENELRALLARHPDNMLFGRAVAQYAADHGYNDPDLRVRGQIHVNTGNAKNQINGAYDIVLRYVSDDRLSMQRQNPGVRAFERMEAEGLFDNL